MSRKKSVREREIEELKSSLTVLARDLRYDYRRNYDEVSDQDDSVQLMVVLTYLGREIEEILDPNGYWTSESGEIEDTAEEMGKFPSRKIAKLIAKTQLAILQSKKVRADGWENFLFQELIYLFPQGREWSRAKWIRRLKDLFRVSERPPVPFRMPALLHYGPEGSIVRSRWLQIRSAAV